MKSVKIGAVTAPASRIIRARLLQMSKAKKQGTTSLADLARQMGVTPARVSQIKSQMEAEGISFAGYNVNLHRGRPVTN